MNTKNKIVIIGGTGQVGSSILKALSTTATQGCVGYGSKEFNILDCSTWGDKLDSASTVIVACGLATGSDQDLHNINNYAVSDFATFCQEKGVGKMILISTGAVYGEFSNPTDSNTPTHPNSSYGRSKLDGELALDKNFHGIKNIVRLYFPFGEGLRSARLIARLAENIKNKQQITCRSDGGPFLTMTSVNDIGKILVSDFILKDSPLKIVNLASDKVYSVQQLAIKIASKVNEEPLFNYSGISPDCLSKPYSAGPWEDFNF